MKSLKGLGKIIAVMFKMITVVTRSVNVSFFLKKIIFQKVPRDLKQWVAFSRA